MGKCSVDQSPYYQHRQQRGSTRIGCARSQHVQASRITPSPAHPTIAAARSGSRRHWPAVRVTRPPAANCQARVGSEKDATAGVTKVAARNITNDTAASSASTAKYGRCSAGAEAVGALVRLRRSRTIHVVARRQRRPHQVELLPDTQ